MTKSQTESKESRSRTWKGIGFPIGSRISKDLGWGGRLVLPRFITFCLFYLSSVPSCVASLNFKFILEIWDLLDLLPCQSRMTFSTPYPSCILLWSSLTSSCPLPCTLPVFISIPIDILTPYFILSCFVLISTGIFIPFVFFQQDDLG